VIEPIWYLRSLPYSVYLQSAWWKKRRAQFRASHKTDRCDLCGMETLLARHPFDTELIPIRFEVHHVSYTHLGAEPDEDLRLLCAPCHNLVHFPDSHAAKVWLSQIVKDHRENVVFEAHLLRPRELCAGGDELTDRGLDDTEATALIAAEQERRAR